MKTRSVLSNAAAVAMAAKCKDEALRNGWRVSIAIVDDGGHLLHLERLDGAAPITAEVAAGKARTAALTRAPTSNLEESARERPVILALRDVTPLRGGVPISYEDECIGAIGVSGVSSVQDEQVAQAGVDALDPAV